MIITLHVQQGSKASILGARRGLHKRINTIAGMIKTHAGLFF
jgi:hypothetical protein